MLTNKNATTQHPALGAQRFLLQWLLLRWPVAALILLVFAVAILVTLLYAAPLTPLLYAGQICLVLLLLLGLWDYLRTRALHQKLLAINKSLPESLAHLPQMRDVLGQDISALLLDMEALHRAALSLEDQRYRHLGDYVLRFSHQVKTPLAAARLLLARQDTADSQALMMELDRIDRQVDMMLNFFKLEAGADDLLLLPHTLLPIVQQAVRSQARVFIEKRLSIHLDVPAEVSLVTDQKLLVFVLEQLISNAAKYTQKGGVSLAWLADTYSLTITDTGPGIPKEDLPRVMEQGFTGHQGHTQFNATGMGLYVAKLGADRLGTSLQLTSTLGEGTTASLVFSPQSVPMD